MRTRNDRRTRAHLLMSADLGRPDATGPLPYRIDLLRDSNMNLAWTDRRRTIPVPSARLRAVIERLERATVPFVQSLSGGRRMARSDVVVAMFESEGHFLALCRSLMGRTLRRRGPRLVIVSCWLADLAVDGDPRRRRIYRWIYRGVDLVTVFSSNQVDTLVEKLGIDRRRITVVPFGVDTDQVTGMAITDNGRVAAVGRDLGRDWATFLAATAGTGWGVDLATRAIQLSALVVPTNVISHGYLDHASYLALLASCSVVAVPTYDRQYPTGQTVLIEAMTLGKACVVTDTPAMREYVTDERTALLVPVGDVDGWRSAIDRLLADHDLRERLGRAARDDAEERFGAARMWEAIGAAIVGNVWSPNRGAAERDGVA